VFDRPLALWKELQSTLGGPDTLTTIHLPNVDWVQPTLEFVFIAVAFWTWPWADGRFPVVALADRDADHERAFYAARFAAPAGRIDDRVSFRELSFQSGVGSH
jgi:hypothetical protein